MVKSFSFFRSTLIHVLLFVLPFTLFSCTSELNENPLPEADGYLDLSFSVLDTKADMDSDGAGNFSEGDRIGLYLDGDNGLSYRELTYTGGEWLPRLRRSEFGSGSISLSAHFPAAGEVVDPENHSLDIALDQSGDALSMEDLLFSQSEVESGEYRADMTFRHALHRIRISFSGTESEPEVKVRSIVEGKMNLLTGKAEATGTGFRWIVPGKDNAGNLLALVIPQSAIPYRDGEGLLNITVDGKIVTYNAPEKTEEGADLVFFESGKQTSVNLSVRPGNPELAGKSLWVYGLDVPDFPGKENLTTYRLGKKYGLPEGQWLRYDNPYYEEQYLTWADGCGWIDCNKSHGNSEDDSNMCWAATAADVVTWWMYMNKEYLAAYDRDYGSKVATGSGEIERPSYEFRPLYPDGVGNWDGSLPEPGNITVNRSEVFQFFKHNFPNYGNDDAKGVNWFFTGAYLGGSINGFEGFFPEVFSRNDVLTARTANRPDKAQFNAFVTDALLNKRAIGINALDVAGPGTGVHAMAAWGVEYDDAGDIAYIYYCDNNFADQDPNGAVIVRKQIVHATDAYGKECTYLQQLKPEDPDMKVGKFLITSVFSADLRRDIWKKKYPDVVVEK